MKNFRFFLVLLLVATLSIAAMAQVPTSNLLLCLRTDAGVDTLNGTVNRWHDKSGNGYDSIQTNTSRQPLLVANALNVTVSLFGQDNSNVYTVGDLGLSNLRTNQYSIPLSDSNLKTDSIAAKNMLWKPFNTNTIVVQALGGILFAAGGAAIGYLASPKSGDASGVGGGLAFALGVTLTSIALPTGIYLGRNIMGGNGGFWTTLGGCVAGLAFGFLPNTLNVKKDAAASVVVFGLCTIGGGIVGYNLFASPVYEEKVI